MLLSPHTDLATCPDCDEPVARPSRWCGRCGAPLATPADDDVAASRSVGQPLAGEAGGRPARLSRHPRTGRVVVALLGLGAVLAATVLQPWHAPVEPLLGRMDVATGVSATGPPPAGLRVDWEVPRPTAVTGPGWYPVDVWFLDGLEGPVAVDDLVRVGDNVVDTVTGDLVRVDRSIGHHGQPVMTLVEGDELLVLDTLTGAVLRRGPAPAGWDPRDSWGWAGRSSDGVTFLSDVGGSVLVRDDGTVVAELDQWMLDGVDRAWADPAAYPVRTLATEGDESYWDDAAMLRSPLSLVDAATGVERFEVPGDRFRAADVMGDLALVASTDDLPQTRADDRRQAVMWSVQLLDSSTGAQLGDLEVAAAAAPRWLGRLGDGTPVIAVTGDGSLDLLAVTRDGPARTVLHTDRVGQLHQDITALPAAAVADDVLVVQEVERLVARGPDGELRWEVTPPPVAVRSAGRHVVTADGTGAVRILRASDGEVVASLPATLAPWAEPEAGAPVAALGGHVGFDRDAGNERRLLLMGWLDLRTGRTSTSIETLDPLPSGAPALVKWLFLGTVASPEGAIEPLLGQVVDDGFEVFDPRSGVTHHPLPIDAGADAREDVTWTRVEVVGGTAEHLVLTSERTRWFDAWSSPYVEPELTYATHLVDRVSDDVTTVSDVGGLVLAGDVVVGDRHERDGAVVGVVGLDVATGAVRWSLPHRLGSLQDGALVADGDLVVHADLTHVTARSTRDGTVRWRHESNVQLADVLVLGPDQVVTATTRSEVLALDRQDGTIAWRTPIGAPVAGCSGAGDHVLVGTYDGAVVQLDTSGREVQRIVVGDGPVHDVAALGTTVVATTPSAVVGLRADTGDLPHRDEVDPGLGRR